MKVYLEPPIKEAIIVRSGASEATYDIWILEPQYIGTIRRVGTQRIIIEGKPGIQYSNLNNAARALIEVAGITGLDKIPRQIQKRKIDPLVKISGSTLYNLDRNAFDYIINITSDLQDLNPSERARTGLDKIFTLPRSSLLAAGLSTEIVDAIFAKAS